MNKKTVCLLAGSSLLLVGCTGASEPSSTVTATATTTVTVTATPSPSGPASETRAAASSTSASASTAERNRGTGETSERGNVVKKVGEWAGLKNYDDVTVDFRFTAIDVDPECTGEYVQEPERGHFIVLNVEVETYKALADSDGTFQLAGNYFKTIGKDGITSIDGNTSPASYSCFPESEYLPGDLGPSEKAKGKMVLDTSDTSGVLIYSHGPGPGWEWKY